MFPIENAETDLILAPIPKTERRKARIALQLCPRRPEAIRSPPTCPVYASGEVATALEPTLFYRAMRGP